MQVIDKTRICAAFDKAAEDYDAIAIFQQTVCNNLIDFFYAFSVDIPVPDFVLDGGCGTGYGSILMSQMWPKSQITGCDLSTEMLRLAQEKNIHTVCADLEQLPFSDKQFDLVWSSLALQWCKTPEVYQELYRVLKQEGVLLFATLGPDTLKELNYAFSAIDQHRHVRSFFSEAETKKALQLAGFQNIQLKSEMRTIYFPDFQTLLKSVKGIGANQVGNERRKTLLGKNAWKSVQTRYETLQSDSGLPVTYNLIFGFAKR